MFCETTIIPIYYPETRLIMNLSSEFQKHNLSCVVLSSINFVEVHDSYKVKSLMQILKN